MKKSFLLILFLLSTVCVYAYSTKHFKPVVKGIEDKITNIYSSGKKTVSETQKIKDIDGKKVLITLGMDAQNKISFVSVKGEISKQNAFKMHDLAVAGTCLTDCTRGNKCSDKSTSVGVGVCVGECAIDCIAAQF
ncbi:hypothetical protein PG291_04350 [Riemerella anatipestifer]|nr:hypothetical protein [Riemerella anatipestifer]